MAAREWHAAFARLGGGYLDHVVRHGAGEQYAQVGTAKHVLQVLVTAREYLGLAAELAVKRYAVMYPLYLKRASVNVEPLTASEREVLQLLCSGLSNAEIAQLLGVRLRTVKFHLGNVYSKLGVKTRVQAIARARELDMFNSLR